MNRTTLETGALLVSVLAVAWLDWATGPDVSFGLFYLVPIGVGAGRRGLALGLSLAGLSAAGWFTADFLFREEGWLAISAWNAFTRLVMFGLIAKGVADLRQSRVRIERKLEFFEEQYKLLFNGMLDGVALHEIICTPEGVPHDYRFLAVNPAFERLTGLRREDVVGRTVREVMPDVEPSWIKRYGDVALTGDPAYFQDRSASLKRHFEVAAFQTEPGGFAAIFRDVTEEKQLQQQLIQAQKMEAVGRLAGGVAHDFNNVLTTIMASAHLLGADDEDADMRTELVGEIVSAATRATGLTRQLLAFSRKAVSEPAVLDLGRQVHEFQTMAQRLVGEDIGISVETHAELPWVCLDPTHVEQILLNLVVNARDAMPRGGKLTIEVSDVYLDSTYAHLHVDVVPGPYVLLAVSDSGVGMDAETASRVFEPFFTTKPEGKGTGLGLSTVYGIVKQGGGTAAVYSEPGVGTVFKVYLPRVDAGHASRPASLPSNGTLKGTETVLVVEDDESVRSVMRKTLETYGYRVLDAPDAAEAHRIFERPRGTVDLLVTDVVLHGTSGPELAEELRRERPGLRVLYVSGYSAGFATERAALEDGAIFLSKPFAPVELAHKVRFALTSKR